MRRPITPRMHGVIDYATTAATAAAPMVLGMPKRAKQAAEMLAGGMGGLVMMTDYPLGVKRKVPVNGHGAADAVLGMVIPALPWVLGVAKNKTARNFFLGLATVGAVATALTDWDAQERSAKGGCRAQKPRSRAKAAVTRARRAAQA